jgi:hypothetical protein
MLAEDDIYGNKLKYDLLVKNYKDLVNKPDGNAKQKYYCKNSSNIKYFPKLFTYFESRDLSFIRRLPINDKMLIPGKTYKVSCNLVMF